MNSHFHELLSKKKSKPIPEKILPILAKNAI
jgi:hypothetical protein